jgi:hypothetical protein
VIDRVAVSADRVSAVPTDLQDWEEEVIDRPSGRFARLEERDLGTKIRVVLMTSTE